MSEEKRKYLRMPAHNRVFIELEAPGYQDENPSKIAQCHSLDVSRTGLRVHLDQALVVGAILQIGVEIHDRDNTLYLAGEVKWCDPDPDTTNGWVAGFKLMDAAQSDIDHWYTLWAILER